ncbi:hypothetical protein F0L68_07195 [Solihabitans fulvus]|uniref:DUF5667 domain-containing protein n=1 Tax=Solihabitans fulvus TaxID=1892852 RepID=A0A5B2XPH2_9PSEU|nr:DUF5667 domain-containing protein [Solihabitans fulvus]KAA2264854.1 hypothetical protein F0L68_07195 [Solihabitans fulvus]
MDRARTPFGRRRQREGFARAVGPTPAPGRTSTGSVSEELAVVALLRRTSDGFGPDAQARDRIRERVVAGLAEPEEPLLALDEQAARPEVPASRRPTEIGSGGTVRGGSGGLRGRFAVAMVAAFCLVLSLAGMSLLLSRDALPGDTLYGIKRSAESASLGLTFGDGSKALKHLEFAAARLSEVETLVDRYRDSSGGPVGSYLSAFADFDSDAAAGARQLTALGVNQDPPRLDSLRGWVTDQAARLAVLQPQLPSAAQDRAAGSVGLLGKITQRAAALHDRLRCYTVTSGATDDVGPLPATDDCSTPRPDAATVAQQPQAAEPTGQASQPRPSTASAQRGQPSQQPAQSPTQQPAAPAQTTGTTPGRQQPSQPTAPPVTGSAGVTIPLPLPLGSLPPLLPGLPGLQLGG